MDTCSYDSLTVLIPHLVLILAYGGNAGMVYNCTIYVTCCYVHTYIRTYVLCGSVKLENVMNISL